MSTATAHLRDLFARNRRGQRTGVYSVCSAHPLVLEAALGLAAQRRQVAVIEATCNQVNHEGGYTGMQPADFAARVKQIADGIGYDGHLVLGGDHLGPQPWRRLAAGEAMLRAEAMVRAYVGAGFTKIHVDCSMPCADDPADLSEDVIAERAARLAAVAESAAPDRNAPPIYIIGTEVPPPGGMGEGHDIVPTSPASVSSTWSAHAAAFASRGLGSAMDRVVAMVVQPGLDFGNESVVPFRPAQARALCEAVLQFPAAIFEAHSTDYQQPAAYRSLVEGHFAILKVGPAATFALREALYALEAVEAELIAPEDRSGLRAALEAAMLADPGNWASHYHGDQAQQHYLRHFSYSDRSRYYWTVPAVDAAVKRLFANLSQRLIPLPLISQYLPQLRNRVEAEGLAPTPRALGIANVQRALSAYADACGTHAAA